MSRGNDRQNAWFPFLIIAVLLGGGAAEMAGFGRLWASLQYPRLILAVVLILYFYFVRKGRAFHQLRTSRDAAVWGLWLLSLLIIVSYIFVIL